MNYYNLLRIGLCLSTLMSRRSHSVAGMRIAVVGSGNFGSVVARNVARNIKPMDNFHKTVKMWVHDELVNGKSLIEIINTQHMNVKYLPGVALPPTVEAVSDVLEVCAEADILLFVVPHQFLPDVLRKIKGKTKPTAVGVSLIKSIDFDVHGPKRCSELIQRELSLREMAVVMGANIAHDIASDSYAEATVASANPVTSQLIRSFLDSDKFRTDTTTDVSTVEYCGALKNVVAVGAGICEGIGATDSSKAALMRQGMKEIALFAREFDTSDSFQVETMFLSCGIADLIATCHSGRNSRCGAAFARELLTHHPDDSAYYAVQATHTNSASLESSSSGGSETDNVENDVTAVRSLWEKVTEEVCAGQKPPGIATSEEVMRCLLHRYGGSRDAVYQRYPLFTRIFEVAIEGHLPDRLFRWL